MLIQGWENQTNGVGQKFGNMMQQK